jgi:hypothetical protein
MEPRNRIVVLIVTALLERLYFFIPCLGAAACFWCAGALAHAGSTPFVGKTILSLLFANLGAAVFILIFGAPGVFGGWRRWCLGLLTAVSIAVTVGWTLL